MTPSEKNMGERSVASDAIAVFAYGLSMIGQAISMAVLIFAGPLESGLPRAVASFCIAGGVLAVYVALRSHIVPAASVIQDAPAIVLVAVAAGGVLAVVPRPRRRSVAVLIVPVTVRPFQR